MLKAAIKQVLDTVLPPVCSGCRNPNIASQGLCADCWSQLDFILDPHCAQCGIPFDAAGLAPENMICAACLANPPAYRRARAVWVYDGLCRDLILRFKHADALHLATPMAMQLDRILKQHMPDAAVLVPVPLHLTRLMRRKYNQAAVLARHMSRISGVPVLYGGLERQRATMSQGELSRSGRQRNVRGAFRVPPSAAPGIKGKAVVVLDDVHTTGATVSECARVLQQAGAKTVDVLTLARVVKGGHAA